VSVSGRIAADARPQLRTVTVDDAARFARTAFIEALARAGVTVSAAPTRPNADSELPASAEYAQAHRLAVLVSPPYSEYATMILKMSHNLGANLGLCLMAVHSGSTDCSDGFSVMRSFLQQAGVDPQQLAQSDGRGGTDVDVATPRAVVGMLRYWLTRPDAAALRATLPVLGVDGSLALSGQDTPAQGKVLAKTGTFVAVDPLNARVITQGKALAGYLVLEDGRMQVFDIVVNQAPAADFQGVIGIGDDLTRIASLLQEGN
jgi:D-alanyl-D-alanine carboxypeptidase/D-alanyl-D-alanine-endopeptidase (penicillin-binding protein 4)